MAQIEGNKQRQRERQAENFQAPSHRSSSSSGKRRNGSPSSSARRISPTSQLPELKPTPQATPHRQVEVTTTNINDLFASSSGPPMGTLVVPESSRQHRNQSSWQHQQQQQHSPDHVPVKVHVAHKPTVEDITRVYNPYPFKVEAQLLVLCFSFFMSQFMCSLKFRTSTTST